MPSFFRFCFPSPRSSLYFPSFLRVYSFCHPRKFLFACFYSLAKWRCCFRSGTIVGSSSQPESMVPIRSQYVRTLVTNSRGTEFPFWTNDVDVSLSNLRQCWLKTIAEILEEVLVGREKKWLNQIVGLTASSSCLWCPRHKYVSDAFAEQQQDEVGDRLEVQTCFEDWVFRLRGLMVSIRVVRLKFARKTNYEGD